MQILVTANTGHNLFPANVSYLYPLKTPSGFLRVSGGIEIEHWLKKIDKYSMTNNVHNHCIIYFMSFHVILELGDYVFAYKDKNKA